MKISNEESLRIAQTSATRPVKSIAPATEGTAQANIASPDANTSAATVTFSAQAQDISRAKVAVDQTPDIRQDKVNALKASIQAGTYNPSGTAIAEQLLRRHEADHIA